MKHKILTAVAAAMATAAFAASTASATTIEVGETLRLGTDMTVSLADETSMTWSNTSGQFMNTCTSSHFEASTLSPHSGSSVTVQLWNLSFTNCIRGVVVHKQGQLSIQHVGGTANGTVSSSGTEVTVGSPFGTLNCKTGTGTHMGTLTGNNSTFDHATIDVSAVVNCGFLCPSAVVKATYTVTSPTGLAVTA